MKTALIIHGTPSKERYQDTSFPAESNKHWIPWLQRQLILSGFNCQTPEMPLAFAPNYHLWSREFERYQIGSDSILVGHSCGAGFLLRWLSENQVSFQSLTLVAPWLDPFKKKCPEFFDFALDQSLLERGEMNLLISDNDSEDVDQTVKIIEEFYPTVIPRMFKGYGHFCQDDLNSNQFPELYQIIANDGC